MITGRVTSSLEAEIALILVGKRRSQGDTKAVIDTGFNWCLSLPPHIIRDLGLSGRRRAEVELADGELVEVDFYDVTVVWDKVRRSIPVIELNATPLVGMELMKGYELSMQIKTNGKVRLKRLPD